MPVEYRFPKRESEMRGENTSGGDDDGDSGGNPSTSTASSPTSGITARMKRMSVSTVGHVLSTSAAAVAADPTLDPRAELLRTIAQRCPCTRNEWVLCITLVLFSSITAAQFIAALHANSLALIADCVSMLIDTLSYVANIVAECLSARSPRCRPHIDTIQLAAAGSSIIVLIFLTTYVLVTAIRRTFRWDDPVDMDGDGGGDNVDSTIVLVFAIIGIVFDLLSFFAFLMCPDMSEGGEGEGGRGGRGRSSERFSVLSDFDDDEDGEVEVETFDYDNGDGVIYDDDAAERGACGQPLASEVDAAAADVATAVASAEKETETETEMETEEDVVGAGELLHKTAVMKRLKKSTLQLRRNGNFYSRSKRSSADHFVLFVARGVDEHRTFAVVEYEGLTGFTIGAARDHMFMFPQEEEEEEEEENESSSAETRAAAWFGALRAAGYVCSDGTASAAALGGGGVLLASSEVEDKGEGELMTVHLSGTAPLTRSTSKDTLATSTSSSSSPPSPTMSVGSGGIKRRDDDANARMNMWSALMHVLADLMRSITTFVEALVIITHISPLSSGQIDAIAAITVSVLILTGASGAMLEWLRQVIQCSRRRCAEQAEQEEANQKKGRGVQLREVDAEG